MFALQVDKKGRVKDRSWKSVQKMMTDPGKFLLTLKADVDGTDWNGPEMVFLESEA